MKSNKSHSEAGRLGGIATSKWWKSKKKQNIKKYNDNPNTCKDCGTPLPYKKRTNKFCNHSCSASFNNSGVARNKRSGKYALKKCLHCLAETINPKYCSMKCQRDYEWSVYRSEIESTGNGNPRNNNIVNHKMIKRYLKEIRGYKCEICGRTKWEGQEIPLLLDHIDGHSEDNSLTNLRLVCGNCDMLLPTYKGKNIGNGRANRRKRYAEGKSY